MGEYFNLEDPRELDGEPEREPELSYCDDCAFTTLSDISVCPKCGGAVSEGE